MDDSRFDALARSLSTAGSRRRALDWLLAATPGILGWHGGEDVAAHDRYLSEGSMAKLYPERDTGAVSELNIGD